MSLIRLVPLNHPEMKIKQSLTITTSLFHTCLQILNQDQVTLDLEISTHAPMVTHPIIPPM